MMTGEFPSHKCTERLSEVMRSKETGVEDRNQKQLGSCNGLLSYIAHQKNHLNHFDGCSKVRIQRIG